MASRAEAIRFHLLSKHHANRFAPGPRALDWNNQPNPFREYEGSLHRVSLNDDDVSTDKFTFRDLFRAQKDAAVPVTIQSVSRMLRHSLGVSARKRYANGHETVLRINPSSGNLHPTEAYLVAPSQLLGLPGRRRGGMSVSHYNVQHNELEVRKLLDTSSAQDDDDDEDADQSLVVAFTSIPWREAWKYGERAFRYCALDLGHALASLEVSCAMLGWRTELLMINEAGGGGGVDLKRALGLEPEGEEPECLVRIHTTTATVVEKQQLQRLLQALAEKEDEPGRANRLSAEEITWPGIQRVLEATREIPPIVVESAKEAQSSSSSPSTPVLLPAAYNKSLLRICHQRRSALDFDASETPMPQQVFYSFFQHEIPFRTLYSSPAFLEEEGPCVHYAIFVHNVQDLTPGLYVLVRNQKHLAELQQLVRCGGEDVKWEKPPGCPQELLLFQLVEGNAQRVARLLSCNQDIAGDSCFSLGMLVKFDSRLRTAWDYKRLFWECGMLGQHLYLTAEVHGARGTGIGCFIDDEVHRVLGLNDSLQYQSLYHFTVGYAVHDSRVIVEEG